MRFAVIADIHGNHLALEAVLSDIDRQDIRDIINLGDCFSGPLNAARTADMLKNRQILTVRGNHDRYLIDRPVEDMGSWEKPAFLQLSQQTLDWLAQLPTTAVFRDKVFACHAAPDDDNLYWLETVTPDGRLALSSPERIEALAMDLPYKLMLCGHSHVARLVTLNDGRCILNPGSVGIQAYEDDDPVQPHFMEAGHSLACYAVVELTGGVVKASFHQVPYDYETMAKLAEAGEEHQWALALRHGRAKPSAPLNAL